MVLHIDKHLAWFEVGRHGSFRLVGDILVHLLYLFFLVCELDEALFLFDFEVFHQFLIQDALVLLAILPFIFLLLLLSDFGSQFPLTRVLIIRALNELFIIGAQAVGVLFRVATRARL